jgi:LacI family transcriptional regulator
MAIGAYASIYRHGLSIPSDISIVGHDNIDQSKMMIPALTTVDTFKFRLGQEGTKMLFEVMKGQIEAPYERVFRTELVERDSVRRLG